MNGSLYISANDGRVWKYDGTTIYNITSTPFSSTNYVTAMVEFNNTLYYGTDSSKIYRFVSGSYQNVYNSPTNWLIEALEVWEPLAAKAPKTYQQHLTQNLENLAILLTETGESSDDFDAIMKWLQKLGVSSLAEEEVWIVNDEDFQFFYW